jgi:NAD(P)H-nitrite reductase large subunit
VLKLGSEVTAVSTSERTVTLKSGEVISYNKLIFANGSSSFIPNLPGHDLSGVFIMKVKADADRIREYAKGKQKAVVIGGGVLGLEAADALRELGLNVTVLEFSQRIMPRQLETGPSDFLQDLISHSGVQLFTGAATKEIRGENGVVKTVVVIPDTEIPADLVILSLGVRANIQLAESAGVQCERGIIVNEKMETNVPGVYAAGDVAQFGNLRIQLWSPALEQGRVAGINAVGDSATFKRKVEPLSLLVFGTELFAAGDPLTDATGIHTFTDKNEKTGKYMRLVFKEDRLIYGVTFKNSEKFSVILNGVREGHPFASVLSQIY